ncbi:hypothetical protein [Paenibacillus methanolicus]|uniref:Uncharacterized protein n=1 Tax=Paenibacillus methanolicus TaxID=582686 RepID=A0A5S5C7U5_9BACL|nr:hypothetical protein [Paenibacillus methanolicus]TYP74063.1 hypothetical protein BCM02_106344 [Paenibacillus methanolicus]
MLGNERTMPSFLHEVFGAKQSVGTILAIVAIGTGIACALWLGFPDSTVDLPAWRTALALLLIFDVGAGCAANFTASTNDFYAADRRKGWLFIAVHAHLPVIAALLGADLGPALAVWAFTISGASAVYALSARPFQRFIGGMLLAAGVVLVALLPYRTEWMSAVSLLFMLKVLYSFAVDHEGRNAGTGNGAP